MRALFLLSLLLLTSCVSPQEAAYRADRDASIKRFNARIAAIPPNRQYGSSGWQAYGYNVWFPPGAF